MQAVKSNAIIIMVFSIILLTFLYCCASMASCRRLFFLDIGANRGDTLRMFYKEGMNSSNNPHPFTFTYDPSKYKVIAVEALKSVHGAELEKLKDKYHFELIWGAVGVQNDGQPVKIYRDEKAAKNGEWGAGVIPVFSENYEEVKVFDLSLWIGSHVRPEDEVVMKLNIEGSEFSLLDSMIEDNTLCLLDKLHVYFHASFFPKNESQILLNRIQQVYQPEFNRCGIYIGIFSVH